MLFIISLDTKFPHFLFILLEIDFDGSFGGGIFFKSGYFWLIKYFGTLGEMPN